MDKIYQHINTTNYKVNYHDRTRKMIVHLGSNKGNRNNDSTPKVTDLQNHLLMSIFDTTEKDVSHGEGGKLTRKVCTSSVKPSC